MCINVGNVHPKDSLEMSSNPKAQLIKHGFGVYIYSKKDGVAVGRYEGGWEKDKKSKTGKMHYDDGSVYSGGWKEDQRSDTGSMVWSDGSSYDGSWRRDRFEGPGHFKRIDGGEMKGLFRCNYFIDNETLRNPFLTEGETERFLKARKDVVKLKEKIAKIKVGFFKRAGGANLQEISKYIAESNGNNRVPLLFSTTDSHSSLADFCKEYTSVNGRNTHNFDLRRIYTLNHEDRIKYKAEVRKELVDALNNGGLFLINLDESETAYDQIFYPDIKEFYDSESLPSHIWSRK